MSFSGTYDETVCLSHADICDKVGVPPQAQPQKSCLDNQIHSKIVSWVKPAAKGEFTEVFAETAALLINIFTRHSGRS